MHAAKRELLEIWVGAAIILAIVAVTALIFGPTPLGDGSYEVSARFSRADGLRVGSTVQAAGVPVGKVQALRLDENYRAVATLKIDSGVVLDSDATASIVTDGLFGDKFIQLDVGAGDREIGNGEEITYTEDALVLDDLLELIIGRARQARASAAGAGEEDPGK